MKIEFHIDQINEMLKFLDELPHKFSRGLVDFIKDHTQKQIDAVKSGVADIQQTVQADEKKVETVVADIQQ
jgi:hypothetical protein